MEPEERPLGLGGVGAVPEGGDVSLDGGPVQTGQSEGISVGRERGELVQPGRPDVLFR